MLIFYALLTKHLCVSDNFVSLHSQFDRLFIIKTQIIMEQQKRYGHFDDQHREYVITDPQTPWPWINYLAFKIKVLLAV